MSTHLEKDGTIRQDHYGAGRQPWDDIKDAGWAPHFAAANVLKYLRRTKDLEHSLQSARWYWTELNKMADAPASSTQHEAFFTRHKLMLQLSKDEINRIYYNEGN